MLKLLNREIVSNNVGERAKMVVSQCRPTRYNIIVVNRVIDIYYIFSKKIIKVQRANLTCDVIKKLAPFVLSKL